MIPPEPSSTSSPLPGPSASRKNSMRLPLSNLQIILIALMLVGLRLVIDFSQRIVEGQQKVEEQRALEVKIDELKQEQRELEADKAYYNSPPYIEVWAHSEGKMVRDGERLVIPIYENPPTETPQQQTSEVGEKTSIPPWQVWWALFFDTTPPSPEYPQP